MGDAVSDTVFDESYLLADIGDTINVVELERGK